MSIMHHASWALIFALFFCLRPLVLVCWVSFTSTIFLLVFSFAPTRKSRQMTNSNFTGVAEFSGSALVHGSFSYACLPWLCSSGAIRGCLLNYRCITTLTFLLESYPLWVHHVDLVKPKSACRCVRFFLNLAVTWAAPVPGVHADHINTPSYLPSKTTW